MTQEELIKSVGKVIPAGMYSEETIQLAFTMFTHGYEYSFEKVCGWLDDNACEYVETVPLTDHDELRRFRCSDMINDLRKTM